MDPACGESEQNEDNGRCVRPKAEFRPSEWPSHEPGQRFGAVSERDTLARTIDKKLSRIALVNLSQAPLAAYEP